MAFIVRRKISLGRDMTKRFAVYIVVDYGEIKVFKKMLMSFSCDMF